MARGLLAVQERPDGLGCETWPIEAVGPLTMSHVSPCGFSFNASIAGFEVLCHISPTHHRRGVEFSVSHNSLHSHCSFGWLRGSCIKGRASPPGVFLCDQGSFDCQGSFSEVGLVDAVYTPRTRLVIKFLWNSRYCSASGGSRLLTTAGAGGSDGYRTRAWKPHLARPPGCRNRPDQHGPAPR